MGALQGELTDSVGTEARAEVLTDLLTCRHPPGRSGRWHDGRRALTDCCRGPPLGGLTGGMGLRSHTTDDEGRSGARMGALPQHPETDFTDTPGPFWGFLFGTNDE